MFAPNTNPIRRGVPDVVQEAARKLDDLLKKTPGLPGYDIAFFKDKDGPGVGIRFHGDLPGTFRLPENIDGIRVRVK